MFTLSMQQFRFAIVYTTTQYLSIPFNKVIFYERQEWISFEIKENSLKITFWYRVTTFLFIFDLSVTYGSFFYKFKKPKFLSRDNGHEYEICLNINVDKQRIHWYNNWKYSHLSAGKYLLTILIIILYKLSKKTHMSTIKPSCHTSSTIYSPIDVVTGKNR